MQQDKTTCLSGHEGPLCSLCASGYAMQSGKCRECGSLGPWPPVIAAALALLVFIFLFFFSWFPLFPEWLQAKLSFSTDKISEHAAGQAASEEGKREEVNLGGNANKTSGSESQTQASGTC